MFLLHNTKLKQYYLVIYVKMPLYDVAVSSGSVIGQTVAVVPFLHR